MNKSSKHVLYGIGVAVLLSITGGFAFELLGQIVKSILLIGQPSFLFETLGSVGLLLAFFLFGSLSAAAIIHAAHTRREWASISAHMVETGPRANCQVLILGVSLAFVYGKEPKLSPEKALEYLVNIGIEKAGAPAEEVKNAGWDDQNATGHSWTTSLCAIRRHLGRLKAIYVVPSVQTFEAAKNDFIPFLDGILKVSAHEEIKVKLGCDKDCAPDYLDLMAVQASLNSVLEKAIDEYGVEGQDICVDSTAGQKPFSIAAGSVTYNTRTLFGYVDTKSRKVRCYDARVDLSLFTDF